MSFHLSAALRCFANRFNSFNGSKWKLDDWLALAMGHSQSIFVGIRRKSCITTYTAYDVMWRRCPLLNSMIRYYSSLLIAAFYTLAIICNFVLIFLLSSSITSQKKVNYAYLFHCHSFDASVKNNFRLDIDTLRFGQFLTPYYSSWLDETVEKARRESPETVIYTHHTQYTYTSPIDGTWTELQ